MPMRVAVFGGEDPDTGFLKAYATICDASEGKAPMFKIETHLDHRDPEACFSVNKCATAKMLTLRIKELCQPNKMKRVYIQLEKYFIKNGEEGGYERVLDNDVFLKAKKERDSIPGDDIENIVKMYIDVLANVSDVPFTTRKRKRRQEHVARP